MSVVMVSYQCDAHGVGARWRWVCDGHSGDGEGDDEDGQDELDDVDSGLMSLIEGGCELHAS